MVITRFGFGLCIWLARRSFSNSHGSGKAHALLHGNDTISPSFPALKFLAIVLSSISGIPGELFTPSLSVGAGLGAALTGVFAPVPVGALVLIGMVAYPTGVLQAAITAFVIVSEMTQNHAMMIPLMLVALIADVVSKLICRGGLYPALAAILLAQAQAEAPR